MNAVNTNDDRIHGDETSAPAPPRSLKRLFVSIPLPGYAQDRLARLREKQSGFRWVPREQIHLTLRFIGEVDEALEGRICESLGQIVVEPFILPIQEVATFPVRGHPNVVFVGVARGHPRLFQLQHRVEQRLVQLGIEPERRAYRPHITLARTTKAAPETVYRYVKKYRDFEAPPIRVDRFSLYSSELREEGALHHEEATWHLAEAA